VNPKKRLGELLIEAGVIGETQLKAALGHQRQWGVRLGQALVDLKLATEADIVQALSSKFGFPVAQLGALEPYPLEQALALLPREFAVRNNVFPMAADTATFTVAMSDPTNLAVVDEIRFRTGRRVKVSMGGDREIADAVRRHYPSSGDAEVEAIALDLDADDGQNEAVFDPFGGGSKDALEAFFGQQPEQAIPPPASVEVAPAPQPPAAARARPAPAAPAASAPAARAPRPGTAPAMPAAVAPARPAAAPTRSAMPAAGAVPPADQGPAARPAPRPAPPAPPAAPARPAPAPAARAAAAPSASPAPARPAAAPGAAPPARAPAPAPAARSPGPARRVELELEEPALSAAALGATPAEVAPFPADVPNEPILATDLAPQDDAEERPPGALTPDEVAILDALERLAAGHHAEPDILKPAQAMAALVQLLLRKRIVTEREFLDALKR
jgi:hypothetical protein